MGTYKMKIKKQITIVAEILVDEDFDTNVLCICQDTTSENVHETFVGQSDEFELLDYVSQSTIDLENNDV